MSDVLISSLEPHLQKQVESARAALDSGRPEQALEFCAAVLAEQPDCLQVRKLERAGQLRLAARRRSLMTRFVTAVSTAPFLLNGSLKLKDEPRSVLATAERLLRRDPHNVAALNLLGQAATQLGWIETAIFAYETASDLEPERCDLLVSLGNAYLANGRPDDATSVANQALQLEPANPHAQTLHHKSSISVTAAIGKRAQSVTGQSLPV